MEYLLVLKWLLATAALSAVGAPLAALAFPRLPRRGAAFALPAAFLPLTLVTFWIGQVTFGLHAVVAALLVVVALSAAAYRLGGTPDWGAVARAYGVFVAGFTLLVAHRAYDPPVRAAGGERFLHFGVTKSIVRAGALPPEDFWYAGEALRYYYGTQLQVAILSMLTGTPVRYGFNLGPAVLYGVLVVAAFGLAGAIVARRGRSYRLGGALGAFFVALGGATTTTIRFAYGLLPREIALQYGGPVFGAIKHMPYEEAVVTQSDPGQWGWFFTRYVIPNTLHEFPAYSFVKGDLHGHALSTGLILVAAALAYSYYLLPAERRLRRAGVLFGGIGVVAGVFGFSNTWSLPTAVGLAWLALAAADAHPATLLPGSLATRLSLPAAEPGERGWPWQLLAETWRLVLAAVLAGLVGVVGVALASPFLVFGAVPTNDGLGLFPPRTPLAPFLVVYAGLLALFAAYVLARGWPAARRASWQGQVGAALAGLAVVAPLLVAFPVLAITGPLLLAAWWLVRTDRAGFEAVLLVAGVGLLLSMELVYAKVWPPEQVRWNTTLKVAVQGWTLAAAGAGAVSALLLAEARDVLAAASDRFDAVFGSDAATSDRTGGTAGGQQSGAPTSHRSADGTVDAAVADGGRAMGVASAAMAAVLVVGVVLASSPFAVMVFGTTVGGGLASPNHEASVDGLATHDRWKGKQMEAIYWLDDREGTPTIAEAPGKAYSWTSPASTFTGLPSVVGWSHQQGYRGEAAYARRMSHVDAIYEGPWRETAAALRYYDVQYVWVGPNERERYGDWLRDFRGPAFSVAFQNEAVTIYAVDHSELPDVEPSVLPGVNESVR